MQTSLAAIPDDRWFCASWQDAHTIAPGIRVPAAIADYLILDAIRDSKGAAVAVSDEEILAPDGRLARPAELVPK